MTNPNRRTFLGAAGALTFAANSARAKSANETVRMAVIGVRSRGADHARGFSKLKNVEVAAICDIDDAMFKRPLADVEKNSGQAPKVEKDFRRLLDDKSIDAIAIGTPDHWHALMTVMGCQAGKDVYCEKPASHNLVEGRRMVQAARKYNRIVQLGTQRRSAPHVQEAIAFLRSDGIGKVGQARAWIHQKRSIDVSGTPTAVPPGIDYDMWQGPALDRPYIKNRHHYNWHWFWNWGTGELGNNGVHGVDVARWGLNVDAPLRVTSGGGLYVFNGLEVPDTQVVTWEFPACSLVWEHRMWSKHGLEGLGFGIAFYGDKGTLLVDEKSWKLVDADGKTAGGSSSDPSQAHFQNFIDCVRSRSAPNADIEVGHLTTRLLHIGNIAHRTGRKLTFDAASESFPGDDEANKLLSREYSKRFEMPAQV
jgi:predicted dehydrogenase